MKLIIPMAGMGKRMRPHTLTIPKPLLPIAGKPIVQRLAEEIAEVAGAQLEEIAFIIGDFGKDVENQLLDIAKNLGATGKIYFQEQALGTAHAIYCAAESLQGNVTVAFADTLFKADFYLDTDADAVIWSKQVENPQAFGVLKVDNEGFITDFIEKPKIFVSDLAIIGIYYFKSGEQLAAELKYLLDNKIVVNGEYQLTDALENMKNKGVKFKTATVDEWLDCGNKDSTVATNGRILWHIGNTISESVSYVNSVIIEPCFLGENVVIENSVIGPFVSVEAGTQISKSVISNAIIGQNTKLSGLFADNCMLGNYVELTESSKNLSIGDFSALY